MMMNFWKRSGQKDKCSQTASPPAVNTPCNGNVTVRNSPDSPKHAKNRLEWLFTSDDYNDNATTLQPKNSRLSKNLSEVLNEKGAVGYFIQYLEARGAISYVKFWLDVECFRSSVETTAIASLAPVSNLKREDLESSSGFHGVPSISHDSLSISTDCDSFTADSNSLFDCSYNSASDGTRPIGSDSTDKPSTCDLRSVSNASHCDKLGLGTTHVNVSDTLASNQTTKHKLYQAIVDDAARIHRKYISQGAPYAIRCSDEVRNCIIESLTHGNGPLNPHCFDDAQQFVFQIMERDYFNDFLRSDYHCKHQVDVLTSGNVTLSDILYNETAMFYFMEFLEQEHCRNLLEFWIAATHFRQNLKITGGDINPSEQMQGDAIILYDKYFSLQALTPLGLPDSVRFDIEQNICHENGTQTDCFDKPLRLVELALEKHFLRAFLTSQLFFKYLSDLISTIQTSICNNGIPGGRHRRIGSDTSSEISSVSAHNTLLAMEDGVATRSRHKRCHGGDTDMSIDTRHLYDPDSLWRRNVSGGLALGRVTELGRFETAIEPQPDRKGESKIGMVMKKLVNLQEDKAKEEMAWQIAEMIVKDITSLTLSESPH